MGTLADRGGKEAFAGDAAVEATCHSCQWGSSHEACVPCWFWRLVTGIKLIFKLARDGVEQDNLIVFFTLTVKQKANQYCIECEAAVSDSVCVISSDATKHSR